ncbi:16S rRNA (uracil(1498)-N(3))-methyltransferase [Nitrosospira multiformis]|uniref:Ribosomal RNA small subunit methyltransferase E n=1 Tax=Nitrosospira multiformis TaxID=1231 RepID=A0A1I7FH38_9PROT|nr:16S rRNA (uracil1498-N3)-methyltransferase [Nitrosospira multiformis]
MPDVVSCAIQADAEQCLFAEACRADIIESSADISTVLVQAGLLKQQYYHEKGALIAPPSDTEYAMTLPRFYCPVEIFAEQVLELPSAVAHHAARVLRLEPGDEVVLFNGDGGEFTSVISRISKQGVAVVVERHVQVERESPLTILLAQAVCMGEKMDWIVQKAVELGVTRIQPLITKQSVVRLSGERGEKRVSHLQKVVISACEQCGRNRVPKVLSLAALENWLGTQTESCRTCSDSLSPDACFMLSPFARKGLRDFKHSSNISSIILLVGPEGGFTRDEEAAAMVAGFIPLRLGNRILRTESAALAAVGAMQALWGDY